MDQGMPLDEKRIRNISPESRDKSAKNVRLAVLCRFLGERLGFHPYCDEQVILRKGIQELAVYMTDGHEDHVYWILLEFGRLARSSRLKKLQLKGAPKGPPKRRGERPTGRVALARGGRDDV